MQLAWLALKLAVASMIAASRAGRSYINCVFVVGASSFAGRDYAQAVR